VDVRLCAIAYAGNATRGGVGQRGGKVQGSMQGCHNEGELFECVWYRNLLIDVGYGELGGEMRAGEGVVDRLDGGKRVYRSLSEL
jgi:hypothetical protein